MGDGDNQYKAFKGFKWTVGNEDVPALALVVDQTSRQLHITEPSDVKTDWAVAVQTNPTVYIHSATTPATNYISMAHDGTTGNINPGGAAGKLAVSATWTTAGTTGRPFASNLTTNVQLGGYANAIKGNVDLSTNGGTTGLLSAVIGEITMATSGDAGNYACFEAEMTYGATSGTLPKPMFLYFNTSGTANGDFDSYGSLFRLGEGMTEGTGLMIGTGASTLRISTGSLGATKRYIPLSTVEETYTTAYPIVSTYAGTALTITSTITSADIVSLISATSTATSGQSNAFVATMTTTGDGKSGSVCGNFYMVEGGNTDYVYPIYIGSAAISNKTIVQMAGIFMYLDDMGNAVEHQVGVSINRNITNVGTASDCFLEMRNHGATSATAFIKLVGGATYLWDVSFGDQVVPISDGSDSTNCSHKVAVRMADSTTRYLHLFTD